MRKFLLTFIIFAMFAGTTVPANAATPQDLNTPIARAASYLQRNVRNPQVGSVGGEWTIIALARSGRPVPNTYFQQYFRNVERYVRENNGVLDERRLTEYSRVILALTATGFDPRNIAGHDLTLPLGDFERTTWQGINGAIFALLALDSLDYEIPINRHAETMSTRALFVNDILRQQTPDGGWNLRGETGDPDITGMALQALAKYQDNPEVEAAIDRALDFLSGIQDENGGFTGRISGSEPSIESAVQVLVALTELGIPLDDPRFVKNGHTVLDNVLSFQLADGSFRHTTDSTESNIMSTEIGLYGLVAAQRSIDGRNSLYRMNDRVVR